MIMRRRRRGVNRGGARVASTVAAALLTVSSAASAQTSEIVSLTLSPSTIVGGSGDSAAGTVTLSGPAPSGGAVVTLTSSIIALAATMPSIVVPAGATSATFTIATNSQYRRYSGLAFNVTITAMQGASTRTATLHVTSQPRPADFNSGSTAGANTQWDGLMCGGIAPIGGEQGVLYECSPPGATGFGTCTFRAECAAGCRRTPPNGSTFNDFCATAGPNPIAIASNYIVSGDRVQASIRLEAPAGQGIDQEVGSPGSRNINFNASHFPHSNGGIVFPDGATSVPFEVATSYVPTIQFVQVYGFWFNASIPPLLITNGRGGHEWLAMIPPPNPPATALPTLGDFFISGLNPITGGDQTFGQVDLSGLSRAGGPTLTLTSDRPEIVPSKSFVAPLSENLFGFQAPFETNPVSSDTDVTVTVSDGRYSFSDVLRVRAAPPPPVLSGVSVSPGSVVGGNQATGIVTLSGPQSGPTVVQVSIIDGAPATLPTNDPPCPPASRCHNVTVPAGASSATFTITTSPVTSQFNLNIFATLAGSPNRQTLLLITPGGGVAAKALTINPTSAVGGASVAGTVTLTSAAPAGGAVVTLSKALSNGGAGPVPVSIPANVTVPAGQTSATFNMATSSVTQTTTVRISATYNGVTANADMSLFTMLGQVLFGGNIPGGTAATGTVTLHGAAPSGGVVVSLSSGNPSLLTVPPSVTVAAGQNSATFTANTSPVTATTGVVVSASHAGATVSTTAFLVVSRAVESVTLNPSTVTGGNSSTGTVTLRSATTSNAVVTLASSNTVVAVVPNSVIVPGGQRSAAFTINTGGVSQTTTVIISATHENVTQSATLTVTGSGGGGAGDEVVFSSPTANAPDSGGDGNGFQTNATNAYAVDTAVATDTNSGTSTSTSCTNSGKDRHRFWNFGLTVPAGAAIAGIEVRIDARADSSSGSPRMCVQLSWDGGTTWTTAKATGTLGTSLSSFTLGSATDTWGRTWTAANLANANFRLRVIDVAASTSRDFFLDRVAVRAHAAASGSGVNPPSQMATLSVTATGRSGERVTSSPAGISVNVGSTGTASFATGTSIRLSVSDGRDAIWSGACSSGGNKTETCTFTLTAAASVTANVQ